MPMLAPVVPMDRMFGSEYAMLVSANTGTTFKEN